MRAAAAGRGGGRRGGRFGRASIDLASLVDVTLLLFAYALALAQFQRLVAIGVHLPEIRGGTPADREVTVLAIREDGHLELDGRTIDPAALEDALREDAARPLVLCADRRTPFEEVARALASAALAGRDRVYVEGVRDAASE